MTDYVEIYHQGRDLTIDLSGTAPCPATSLQPGDTFNLTFADGRKLALQWLGTPAEIAAAEQAGRDRDELLDDFAEIASNFEETPE